VKRNGLAVEDELPIRGADRRHDLVAATATAQVRCRGEAMEI
jgi:hypothetical protein